MRFSVDPWDPTYGTGLDTELGHSSAQVDTDVEVPAAAWAPVDPRPELAPPSAVLFVDGVRRVDAQLWVEDEAGDAGSPAQCASYAAGVVCCCADQGAHLVAAEVRRGLFTTVPSAVDVVTSAGVYVAQHTEPRADTAPTQVLSLALQRALGTVELAVADTARSAGGAGIGTARSAGGAGGGDDLLVVDGPLHGRQHLPRTIGFVKSHRSDYLPARLGGIVATLQAGQRTPVFGLGTSWERHTWYLRLPCAPDTPWAGIVRVEAPADLASIALADLSQITLVRFASTAYKDSRAPQNLYPIAGLERALRRRLGEPAMLYRALRSAAMAGRATTPTVGR